MLDKRNLFHPQRAPARANCKPSHRGFKAMVAALFAGVLT
ncbi:hypothetical protein RUM4293_01911 [Ruegeria atlantica]|uniref:Uncharacterized protein n=1 Tax=Ruegeria atlantica TaxID=81569 RepID=A0A0P1E3U8_9RHOB|nr:hypothetical protein RUM4293_01911 [Ruegeria atlantica]